MLFPDYDDTGYVYHVAPITDLKGILHNGIKYNDKITYESRYLNFHKFIDSYKPSQIPQWVVRQKAIFASLNFADDHVWHSHSVLMGVKINPEKCWIANENLANYLYEPFILKDLDGFEYAGQYVNAKGKEIVKKYWDTSLSFLDNLKLRKDKYKGYDAEVLIFHDIHPENIKLIAIASDHRIMTIEEWKQFFAGGSEVDEDWKIT